MTNLSEGMMSVFPAWLCKGLPPPEQTVLAWLWHHRMSSGSDKTPSFNTLAAECGLSRRSVITQIESLGKRGMVRTFTRKGTDGGFDTNCYELRLVCGEAVSPPTGEQHSQGSNGKFRAGPYLDIWKKHFGGYFAVEQCSRQLKRAEQDYGAEVVAGALERYCKSLGKNHQFASMHKFCSTIGGFVDHAPKREYDATVASGGRRW